MKALNLKNQQRDQQNIPKIIHDNKTGYTLVIRGQLTFKISIIQHVKRIMEEKLWFHWMQTNHLMTNLAGHSPQLRQWQKRLTAEIYLQMTLPAAGATNPSLEKYLRGFFTMSSMPPVSSDYLIIVLILKILTHLLYNSRIKL